MPVEVRYHVIREGKEIAVYTSKKEADAHDKMLDIAETLVEFIGREESLNIADEALEELCIYLSKNRDDVVRMLKGMKPAPKITKPESRRKEKTDVSKPDKSRKDSVTATPAKGSHKGQSGTQKPSEPVKDKPKSAAAKTRRKAAGG